MKNTFKFKNPLILLLGTLLFVSNLISCSSINTLPIVNNSGQAIEDSNNQPLTTSNTLSTNISSINDIPKYSGKDIIILNNNVPNFSKSDLTTTSFEKYSPLDSLGRCGVAYSNIGTDVMPTEKRESISSVKPSGWHSVKYDVVEGKYLYNRYFNATLMLPYENMVADYIKETNNHVLYRVTPLFEGNNLVATGIQIEAKSVEDDGEGIEFNVFIYNVQPGITIDYATGDSSLNSEEIKKNTNSSNSININNSNTSNNNNKDNTSSNSSNSNNNSNSSNSKSVIRGNSKSKIYHCPGQSNYETMADSEYLVNFNSEADAIAAGYRKAKR